jgi:hypothetical protein
MTGKIVDRRMPGRLRKLENKLKINHIGLIIDFRTDEFSKNRFEYKNTD